MADGAVYPSSTMASSSPRRSNVRRLFERGRNPLPQGTLAVGAGLLVAGLSAYVFLIVSARALGPEKYAPLAMLWALIFLAAPGFFLPLEQEVARALASRRALGLGGRPVIARAALAGAVLAAVLVLATALARGPLVEQLFDGDGLLLVAFAVGLVGYCLEHLARGTMSGNGRFGPYGFLVGADSAVRLVGAIALALLGVSVAGAYGLAIGLAPYFATVLALRRQRELALPGPEAPWSELSTALGCLLAASVFAQLLVNAGPLAVKLLATDAEAAEAGRFTNGLIVARVPLFLFQAVQAALLPKLAGLAGAGRHVEFRSGLKRLMKAVLAIGVVGTLGGFVVGPLALRVFFGGDFALGHSDLGFLAAASAAYMVALALSQALIALSGFARVVTGWFIGIATFVVITAIPGSLLPRVERGFLAGSLAAAGAMSLLLLSHLRSFRGDDDDTPVDQPSLGPDDELSLLADQASLVVGTPPDGIFLLPQSRLRSHDDQGRAPRAP